MRHWRWTLTRILRQMNIGTPKVFIQEPRVPEPWVLISENSNSEGVHSTSLSPGYIVILSDWWRLNNDPGTMRIKLSKVN